MALCFRFCKVCVEGSVSVSLWLQCRHLGCDGLDVVCMAPSPNLKTSCPVAVFVRFRVEGSGFSRTVASFTVVLCFHTLKNTSDVMEVGGRVEDGKSGLRLWN